MSSPQVVSVAPASPAMRSGLLPGDLIIRMNGEVPRDIIAYRLLADAAELSLDINRGGIELALEVEKLEGESLGAEIHSALFDQVRTCDNHCEFCFIYQLPPNLRESLYLKDDDYRLSFLYGNFTTLTRFTEIDLERVVTERISPLHVSIHATEPNLRSSMLRNRRGATSLRWLRALLDHGIEVHGQVVVCPDRNDGPALEATFVEILDRYSEIATLSVVPLGVSRFNSEEAMRPHSAEEAAAVIELVHEWQEIFLEVLGRRIVHAADEYYLIAGRDFPDHSTYEEFPMHEDGIGMARTFEREFRGLTDTPTGVATGFFAWVDGAPPEGYRAPRGGGQVALRPRRGAPIAVLTGDYGSKILAPLLAELKRTDIRVISVSNEFFGGNTGVAGLLTGSDLIRVLSSEPEGHRYLLPDVCLSQGRFLDGLTPEDLPRPVEILPTDGIALRRALESR